MIENWWSQETTTSENFEGAYLNKEHKKNQDFDSWSICEYKTSC